MYPVNPKKSLGQHFLADRNIAAKITRALSFDGYKNLLEVGPGTGVLTEHLLEKRDISLRLVEIDPESAAYLKERYPETKGMIDQEDFLRYTLSRKYTQPLAIIGNFPYNISSQIFFKILENRHLVKEVVCMVQKEVAGRIVAPPGSKTYGILSVLLQAYYDAVLLFTVPPQVFVPPPKVTSAVIRLTRRLKGGEGKAGREAAARADEKAAGKADREAAWRADQEAAGKAGREAAARADQEAAARAGQKAGGKAIQEAAGYAELPCNEKLFFRVVKTAFNQRRKMLRNSLGPLLLPGHEITGNSISRQEINSPEGREDDWKGVRGTAGGLLSHRPEQLTVNDFVTLTNYIEKHRDGTVIY